jgi:hypothetical protein
MEKHLLCPERVRKIPPQFSWVDQRLENKGDARAIMHFILVLSML